MTKTPKRPRDTNQLAKFVVDVASGTLTNDHPELNAPMDLIRKGGQEGGYVRARNLSPEQRTEIARTAALARWKNR
jgi:hypothetical protein